MNALGGSRAINSVRILNLVLQETGTYNPIYLRPYTTHLDGVGVEAISRRVAESGQGKITGAALAGLASEIVAPAANVTEIAQIENGWTERRIRFFMVVQVELRMGTTMVYYFQGFTNFPGVSIGGAVAPDMVFTINSYIGVSRITRHTPMGVMTQDIVTESSQLLTNTHLNMPYGGAEQFSMRQQDVFSGMQSAYLANGMDQYRVMDARTSLRREPMTSQRSNNMPSSYVAGIVDGYRTGMNLAAFGQSEQDILSRSKDQVIGNERSPFENPFIRLLSDLKTSGLTNRFQFADLQALDPNVANVTQFLSLGPTQLAAMHSAGQTEYWAGSDMMTVMATTLSHAVPALMMDLMISSITFRSTNQDIGGFINTMLIDAKSLTDADMSMNFELFKRRLELEILNDITRNGQDIFALDMSVELFGDSRISISLNGSPMTPFVTPSFCDTLFAPVIAPNRDVFQNLVYDFEQLVNHVTDEQGMHSAQSHLNNAV